MKTISSFPNYEIDLTGNVWSKARMSSSGHLLKRKLMTIVTDNKGYLKVMLSKDGKQHNVAHHRLFAESWIPNPLNLPCINHKNGIKTDNTISNLEWCDLKYNSLHKARVLHIQQGETQARSVLKEDQIPVIRQMRQEGTTLREIGEHFGVSIGTIHHVVKNRSWTHIT